MLYSATLFSFIFKPFRNIESCLILSWTISPSSLVLSAMTGSDSTIFQAWPSVCKADAFPPLGYGPSGSEKLKVLFFLKNIFLKDLTNHSEKQRRWFWGWCRSQSISVVQTLLLLKSWTSFSLVQPRCGGCIYAPYTVSTFAQWSHY